VKLTRTITMKLLVDAKRDVDIMSISSSGELLVGSQDWNESENFLHKYDAEGRHVSSVWKMPEHFMVYDFVLDATWTPRGNIVFTIFSVPTRVVTMTRTGDVVAKTTLGSAYSLSVSADNVIYVACGLEGVYQSADDGLTWSRLFPCSDNYAEQAIKVFSDINTDIFYVLGKVAGNWCLREYRLTKRQSNNNVKWRDVALLCDDPSYDYINMAFDGRTKVFVTKPKADKALRVFSVSQRTETTLDLSEYLSEDICHVAVDSHRNELFVSVSVPGIIKVFTLSST
jgi:hypothetical protein